MAEKEKDKQTNYSTQDTASKTIKTQQHELHQKLELVSVALISD